MLLIIIQQIFLLTRDRPKRVTWPNIPQLKLGNIREYSPILKIARVAKKIDNSPHLGRKYARIFVLGHYLFLVAHSFSRASLSENCLLLGTDNVRGQISEHIFAPNGDYCLYNIFYFLKIVFVAFFCFFSWRISVSVSFVSRQWASILADVCTDHPHFINVRWKRKCFYLFIRISFSWLAFTKARV